MNAVPISRRRWLGWGLGLAAALATGGGWLASQPNPWADGRFSNPARGVWRSVARALLDGVLPPTDPDMAQALDAWLPRLETAVAQLPPHTRRELSQLLGLLALPVGRKALAGLSGDWADAPLADVQQALQGMRSSRLAVRQQAYLALHDLTGATYFSDASTWPVLGYPGPTPL